MFFEGKQLHQPKLKETHQFQAKRTRSGKFSAQNLIRAKVSQPWLHKLRLITIDINRFMSQFNYYVVPTISVPSFYLISLPSFTAHDAPIA